MLPLHIAVFLLCFQFSVVSWFSPTTHDFGVIKQYTTAEAIFHYKNIIDKPLIIDNIRTTCGCTAPDWEKAPILPDSVGTIRIEFDATKTGRFRKRINVFFNTQRKAEILYIQGEVQ